MRNLLVVLWLLFCSISSAAAQVSFGIETPGVSIGINFPVYPQLVAVPGYPVYYAPQSNSNYFFYDGMYWVYAQDNWYASSWYNGPWAVVAPDVVPLFILRVPVRYYRRPPAYFHGWSSNAPPRWGDHWGNTWAQSRRGWDNWNRSSVPAAAPLPLYQRQYSGNKYPRAEQQSVIQSQNYRYQPHEVVVQQHYQAQHVQSAPAAAPKATQVVPAETRARQQQTEGQQKAQQQQRAESQQKAQQQQVEGQQKAQQQRAESQQKAQQQQGAAQQRAQQQRAESQQKAQQQQGAAQQRAQQQQRAESQQKAQQQQQGAAQKQQQQRQAEGQQKAQQQQQGAAQQKAQQPPQAVAPREHKAAKQAAEKADQEGGEKRGK